MVSNSLQAKSTRPFLFGGTKDTMESSTKGCKTSGKSSSFRLRPKFTARMDSRDLSRLSSASFLPNATQSSLNLITMNEMTKRVDSDDDFSEFVLDVPQISDDSRVWCKREQLHESSFEPRPAQSDLVSSSFADVRESACFAELNEMTEESSYQGPRFHEQVDFDSRGRSSFLTPPRSHNRLRMRLNLSTNPFQRDTARVSCDIAADSSDSSMCSWHHVQTNASYFPSAPDHALRDDAFLQTPCKWASHTLRSSPCRPSLYLPII